MRVELDGVAFRCARRFVIPFQRDHTIAHPNPRGFGAMLYHDPFGFEALLHERRNIDIFRRKNLLAIFDDGDLDTEPTQRLPKLATDRPAAEHEHALRL